MNNITFTPSVSATSAVHNIQNRPAFTALPKAPKPAQAKETMNIAKKLYSLVFVPHHEKVLQMSKDAVITESPIKLGSLVTYKKYPKYSRKPSEIVYSDYMTKIKEKFMIQKDGSVDVEMIDGHTKGTKISAAYKGVNERKALTYKDYNGPVKLSYLDKTVEISPEQRVSLIEDFDKTVNSRYADEFDDLLHKRNSTDLDALSTKYYQDEDVIAAAILRSPKYLHDQLLSVPQSMPYGIERIFSKLGK